MSAPFTWCKFSPMFCRSKIIAVFCIDMHCPDERWTISTRNSNRNIATLVPTSLLAPRGLDFHANCLRSQRLLLLGICQSGEHATTLNYDRDLETISFQCAILIVLSVVVQAAPRGVSGRAPSNMSTEGVNSSIRSSAHPIEKERRGLSTRVSPIALGVDLVRAHRAVWGLQIHGSRCHAFAQSIEMIPRWNATATACARSPHPSLANILLA